MPWFRGVGVKMRRPCCNVQKMSQSFKNRILRGFKAGRGETSDDAIDESR
jgi:hypothetical protein